LHKNSPGISKVYCGAYSKIISQELILVHYPHWHGGIGAQALEVENIMASDGFMEAKGILSKVKLQDTHNVSIARKIMARVQSG